MTDFLEIFREEVEGNLKEATELTLSLERGELGRDRTEALMRVFHTLKGAARAMQFDEEKEAAHCLEDVYHDLLDGEATFRPELIELSLQAIDLIRDQVVARLGERAVPGGEALHAQVARYRAGEPLARVGGARAEADAPASCAADGSSADCGATSEAALARSGTASPADPDGESILSIFSTEAREHLDQAQALLAGPDPLGADPTVLAILHRCFGTLKAGARAVGLDGVRDAAGAVDALLDDIAEGRLFAGADLARVLDCALRWLDALLTEEAAGRPADAIEPLLEQIAALRRGEPCGDCRPPAGTDKADDHGHAQTGPSDLGALRWQDAAAGPAGAVASPVDTAARIFDDASGRREPTPAATGQPRQRRRASVAYEQLDRLHRLSGELTVSVGAMAGQRNGVRRLGRELDWAMRQIGKVSAAGVLGDGDGEALHELLRPVVARLDAARTGLETLSQLQDRTEGQLQQLAEHLVDEVTQARLVPLSELLDDYPRMVRDLAKDLGKEVALRIDGDQNRIDRAVLEALRNPLLHLVRNALDHGIEAPPERRAVGKNGAGRLAIEAQQLGSMMRIRVADDGAGIDLERLHATVVGGGRTTEALWQAMGIEEQMQFLFLPGLSTAERVSHTSGRGFGLDIVKTGLDAIGARIGVHSEPGNGSCFELQVPLSLALTRCLLVRGGRHPLFGVQRYAIPMPDVVAVSRLDPSALRRIGGRPAVHRAGETLLLNELSQLVGLAPLTSDAADKHLLILGSDERRAAVLVEAVVDELDVVTRPLDERLGKVQQVAGVTLLDDGGLALVVDVSDLLERLEEGNVETLQAPIEVPEQVSRILVVEDSVTVREVERHFLTQAGYAVTTAVNGVDGLNKAKTGGHDLIVTDIDMPRMNGIELIRTLRGIERFRELPIIVVSYKDRPDDREAALAAGADRYVTKAEFDTDQMLATVAELLGARKERA
jgi:two-component system sensor histidine kinase and response regulator WspE